MIEIDKSVLVLSPTEESREPAVPWFHLIKYPYKISMDVCVVWSW